MSSPLRRAAPDEVPSVFELYRQRIHWMNRQGIRQWNVTEYLSVYPLSYYASCCTAGTLYVWQEAAAPITGSVVLLTPESRWDDGETAATCYIHNLVTAPGCPGTGRRMPAAAGRETTGEFFGKNRCRPNSAAKQKTGERPAYRLLSGLFPSGRSPFCHSP